MLDEYEEQKAYQPNLNFFGCLFLPDFEQLGFITNYDGM